MEKNIKDRAQLMELISINGENLKLGNKLLRNDKEVVLAALNKTYNAYKHASPALRQDPDILKICADKYGHYPMAKAKTKAREDQRDKKMVEKALKMQGNRELILEELGKTSEFFLFLEPSLKTNQEFVLEAIKKNHKVAQWIDKKFCQNDEFMLQAAKIDGRVLYYTKNYHPRDNREIFLAAVKTYPECLLYAGSRVNADREIILEAVKKNFYFIQYIDQNFQSDKSIILAALKSFKEKYKVNPDNIQNYIVPKLLEDPDILKVLN